MKNKPTAAVSNWLYICCAMIFLMVMVGAITRLTESGLSITEWKPVTGALPPITQTQWQQEFDLYQASPEFQKKNFWMELDDFKKIFFWEWFHRLLGRLIGLVYALPLVWFWIKGALPKPAKPKLLGLLALGGAQGLMGWFMVKSGLVDNPVVSHYRLAAHLGLAFLLYALILWMGLALDPRRAKGDISVPRALRIHIYAALMLAVITMVWGAFTAGLDAGLVYNDTFPKMGAAWIPPDMWQYDPRWINFFEAISGVQFTHRWLAVTAVLVLLALWMHACMRGVRFNLIHALGFMALMQLGLGIATLFSGVALPIAAAHQAGALIILTLFILLLSRLKKPGQSAI